MTTDVSLDVNSKELKKTHLNYYDLFFSNIPRDKKAKGPFAILNEFLG